MFFFYSIIFILLNIKHFFLFFHNRSILFDDTDPDLSCEWYNKKTNWKPKSLRLGQNYMKTQFKTVRPTGRQPWETLGDYAVNEMIVKYLKGLIPDVWGEHKHFEMTFFCIDCKLGEV